MPAFLVPVEQGLCVIPLEKAILLIGRQADCDVALTVSRKISRKHCCLAVVNDAVIVRDLGSTNGIAINGLKVEREGRLRVGDELTIGDIRFRLQPNPERLGPSPPQAAPVMAPAAAPVPPRPAAPPPMVVPPAVSMEFPVALAEDGREFAVEPSVVQPKPARRREPDLLDSGPLVPLQRTADADDFIPLKSDSI
jgi:pSer/pThr/pTyr-binding forkhead associated (FHA) protein